jgi:hypothetical protein
MRRLTLLVALATSLFFLSACASPEERLDALGLGNLSAKEILLGLDDGSIVPDGYAVSVYDDELIVLIDDDRIALPMPDDLFYLSVAPYRTLTHDCTFHSATGCRGELKQEEFTVTFVTSDGTTVLDETFNTGNNGFIDLWLPRDIQGTLTITQGDETVSKTISTTAGSPTCETTMRLIDSTQ